MSFSAALLRAALEVHAPRGATGLLVAVSGGGDSAGLLAAVAHLGESPFRGLPVRAVHVDHGLQVAALGFREVCIEQCGHLKIPLTILSAAVDLADGVSIEAAARAARYREIAAHLRPGECLLTAHHSQDQAETLLLQLLRGAGLKGLSAMPFCKPLGSGWHLRPLLEVAHGDLLEFAAGAGMAVMFDPMNVDTRFDRAYLRTQIWPLITKRWPGAESAVSRAARHLADAQDQLEQAAARALQRLRDGDALSVTGLRALAEPEQHSLLRYWILCQGVVPPSTARLTEALRQIVEADADHLPAIAWGSHALRRYRQRLFLTSAEPLALGQPREWRINPGARVHLGPGLGTLRWSPRAGGLDIDRLPATLSVRQRRGGEALRPHARARTHTLQHLCQSLGVLPWMRDALPLLYAGDVLIAVGDLWHDARWCVAAGSPGYGCDWDDGPIIV
jgi:tRNA(Ile)-lysidine synthase